MITADTFYQKNSQNVFSWPKIPNNLDSIREIADWIFNQKIPFIELDLKFDVETWKTESIEAENFYVKHRESQPHIGWKSCCIHGIDVDKTSVWECYVDVEPRYQWTELSEKTPVIKKFCEKLPFEKFARIRFMKLEAEGWIAPHNDTPVGSSKNFNLSENLVPINIAIEHPSECYMTLKDLGIVPWSSGDIKIVNILNDHSVINFNKKDRIHLIVHGWVGNKINEFNDLVVSSYRKQYERYKI